jgi:hypothetical protein
MKGSIVLIFHIKNYSFILILQTDLPTLSIKHNTSSYLLFFLYFFFTVILSVYAKKIFCQCLPMNKTITYLVRKILRNYCKYFFYRDFKLSCQFRYFLGSFLSINLIHKSWDNFSWLANPMISKVTQIKRKGTPFSILVIDWVGNQFPIPLKRTYVRIKNKSNKTIFYIYIYIYISSWCLRGQLETATHRNN